MAWQAASGAATQAAAARKEYVNRTTDSDSPAYRRSVLLHKPHERHLPYDLVRGLAYAALGPLVCTTREATILPWITVAVPW
jgi:hypothetical protein